MRLAPISASRRLVYAHRRTRLGAYVEIWTDRMTSGALERTVTVLTPLILCLFVNLSMANASPADDKIAQRVPEPFQGYIKACGYPIMFKDNAYVSTAEIQGRLGAVITLDPMLASPVEAAHRRFLIAHECGHHHLGHTTPKGLRARRRIGGVEDQELSADCFAAEMLISAGLANEARLMVDRFHRQGLYSPGSGYPSGVQRATLIFHCMRASMRTSASDGKTRPIRGDSRID